MNKRAVNYHTRDLSTYPFFNFANQRSQSMVSPAAIASQKNMTPVASSQQKFEMPASPDIKGKPSMPKLTQN